MELWLRIQPADGAPRDVAVELDPYCPTSELVGALAENLRITADGGELAAYNLRLGTWLSNDEPVAAARLRTGDELLIADRSSTDPVPTSVDGATQAVVVIGGPSSGRRFALHPGQPIVIGSNRDCDVVLDDPSVSDRHLRINLTDGRTDVSDMGSTNGTFAEGAIRVRLSPGRERTVKSGEVLRVGRTLLAVRSAERESGRPPADRNGNILFNRPPRIARPTTPSPLTLASPPDDPKRARIPLVASLIPLVLGLGLWLIQRDNYSFLLFSLLTPVMAGWSFWDSRRSGKKHFAERAATFRADVAKLQRDVEAARAGEIEARRQSAPDAAELIERVRRCSPGLWERRPGDPDFLHLRVGLADQASSAPIRIDAGGSAALRAEAEQALRRYSTVPSVPVVLELPAASAVGLAGEEERVAGLARWLVAQAACLHSPRDLVIAAVVPKARIDDWAWLKWLPHTHGETSPLGDQHLAADAPSASALLTRTAALLKARADQRHAGSGADRERHLPFVLLVLHQEGPIQPALAATILGESSQNGVGVIWIGGEVASLPGECQVVVEADRSLAKLTVTDARTGVALHDVAADGLGNDLASELALALAPIRDASAGKPGGQVPRLVPLLPLLAVEDVTSQWIRERWEANKRNLSAVIGAAADGPFAIDLRQDGPHGVIGGTTQAGKSELLRTLMVSLSASHPPNQISFLLVDFKGGAAFTEFDELPHNLGLVTDLDGHLTQRALDSLWAEVRRREAILREARVNSLPDLQLQRPSEAPASLVILIDEFAALVNEVPEFIDGVVNVAMKGASLGLHLILATQRPADAVKANIRANTNLRIALRTLSTAESQDIVDAPDAAEIPERGFKGRAFARTGRRLTEFQTAYASGVSAAAERERVAVRELAFGASSDDGAREARSVAGQPTDLQRLVAAIQQATSEAAIPPQPLPWLPPLPTVLSVEELATSLPSGFDSATTLLIGKADEPKLQRQRPFALDLEEEGSVLIYGAGGSGKTSLLRTLAVSLATRSSPEDLHVFGLDFATGGLDVLKHLPHCGAVIVGEDHERVTRLLSMLAKITAHRKELFRRAGSSTLSEYRRVAPQQERAARVVVLLDDYGGFMSEFESFNRGALVQELPRLVSDGRSLGVHFLITADRRGAVPSGVAGIIRARIVLRMPSEDEYGALGVDLKSIGIKHMKDESETSFPAGRGFVGGVEVQSAVVGKDPSARGQAAAIERLGGELRSQFGSASAPRIELLPTSVPRDALPAPTRPMEAVLGIGYEELAPATISLDDGHFLVVGPFRSGRTTALATLARSVRSSLSSGEMHVLAPRRSALVDLDIWTSVSRGVEDCQRQIAALAELVRLRSQGEAGDSLIVVIDDGDLLLETSSGQALQQIVKQGRDLNVRVVGAAERLRTRQDYSGWLRQMRMDEHGLLLRPEMDVDGDLLGVALPRWGNSVFPPGRGYLVRRGAIELIQVAAP